MTADFDVIIVGSGPAGVSAAFPLLAAGRRVLMIDGGGETAVPPPQGHYLDTRRNDPDQWHWMIGRDFHALGQLDAGSPKLRVPTHSHVFAGFAAANRIAASDFVAVGSLAQGGLSNAWGCGVARLSATELAPFPCAATDLETSYATVARRMGISGAQDDDLADYFGLDAWAQGPARMDSLQTRLYERYQVQRANLLPRGFRLGRSRQALLTESRGERQACDLSGNCLWGCSRRALYSALEDLALLKRQPGFSHHPGFVVHGIGGHDKLRTVTGEDAAGARSITANKLILAAGTLATTRLALQGLAQQNAGFPGTVTMQACPTAAFLLWLPRMLGLRREAAVAVGQLSFTLALDGTNACGSLFNTTGIPMAEFVRYLPLRRRHGIDMLGALLSSCMVANMFLPGHLTKALLSLASDGGLRVEGGYAPEVATILPALEQQLRGIFWRLGGLLLPGSFTAGQPGSDIHYAGSLPMRSDPQPGETHADGELCGLPGVHVVDGASLPVLTEKPHTLTIMANADRIGRKLARWDADPNAYLNALT